MPALPPEVEVYRRTPSFDASSVPRALTETHSTKAGVWGRIVVEEGRLRYELLGGSPDSWVLRPGVPGVIAPEVEHRVTLLGAARFHVEFLRAS
jgi:ferredoxin